MTKYERIKKLCKERGVSVSQMERDLGFARGSIGKIDAHKPSADRVSKIALYLNASPLQFMMDAESSEDEYNEAMVLFSEIHDKRERERKRDEMYNVSAGSGVINDGYGTVDEGERTNEEHSKVRIVGDSMYPSLHDGDIVIVNHLFEVSDIKKTDFVCVKINGFEDCVKHIEMTDNGIWLRGENPDAYTDTFYSMQDVLTLPVTIVGVVEELVSRKY